MPFPYLLSSCLTVLRPLLFLRRPPVSHRIAVAAERAEDIQHAGRATQDEEEQQHTRLRAPPRVEQNADSHPDPDRDDQLDPEQEGESQERKRVEEEKRGAVGVDLGGGRDIKKKKTTLA